MSIERERERIAVEKVDGVIRMGKAVKFTKYSGAGNDFIMINNYTKQYKKDWRGLARALCPRALSAGADGLIVIQPSPDADFEMLYFNADGSAADMCGNGGRCVSMFAYREGIAEKDMSFVTASGKYYSVIQGDQVRLKLVNAEASERYTIMYKDINVSGEYINTGVPHYVIKGLPKGEIISAGNFFRHHETFAPQGTNVDRYEATGKNSIKIRTYERGVESETLACGTGAVAGAIIAIQNEDVRSPVYVTTKSGIVLTIEIDISNGIVNEIYLIGDAREIYSAEIGRDV